MIIFGFSYCIHPIKLLYGVDAYHCLMNIAKHTTHTIISWPNSKQWLTIHISGLMMITWSSNILTIIKRGIGKMKTHSTIYRKRGNWENWLNLRYTLDRIHLKSIVYIQCSQPSLQNDNKERVQCANKWIRHSSHDIPNHLHTSTTAVVMLTKPSFRGIDRIKRCNHHRHTTT